MRGLMMDFPLTVPALLERAGDIFGNVEIVTRLPDRRLARDLCPSRCNSEVFQIAVVALSAKLAKCDGPVKREEIDTFRRRRPQTIERAGCRQPCAELPLARIASSCQSFAVL